MNNKIKKMSVFFAGLFLIAFLGFAPVGQKIAFSIDWESMGKMMAEAGVIDQEKFESAHGGQSFASAPDDSRMALNMLWAFGLGNKNPILEKGPMMDPRYGGAKNFASTGGWTLARGDAMNHYSMHSFITLSKEQQALVERVAKNVYRPCCGNSTYFPDCNHGMAMLGLLELMAREESTEEEMYKLAEEMNTLWFPEQNKATGCKA